MAMVQFLVTLLALCFASVSFACTPATCNYPVWKEENCDVRDPKLCLEGQVGLLVKVNDMRHHECAEGSYWQKNFDVEVLDIIRNDVDFMHIKKGQKLVASAGYSEDVGCGFSCSTEIIVDNKQYIMYANAIDPDASPIWPSCGNEVDLYVGYCFHSIPDPTEEEIQTAKDTCLALSTSKHFDPNAADDLKALAVTSLLAILAAVLLLL